jgi:hypothetical protein
MVLNVLRKSVVTYRTGLKQFIHSKTTSFPDPAKNTATHDVVGPSNIRLGACIVLSGITPKGESRSMVDSLRCLRSYRLKTFLPVVKLNSETRLLSDLSAAFVKTIYLRNYSLSCIMLLWKCGRVG